ncbi:VIT1/CCC1 transporter family protein [Teredinibacter haidensis]|uniref:VIT1/CCC1 transporter family protein n=1 Tax=Teredinibacter haidensis TaxID=2731755 RepID=UPI000AA6358B|nr:VIT family protein [Teredinibacter haidensis]
MNISDFKNEHFSHRVGWLRAAVLGANDGIVSTASLIIGVASAGAGHADILLAGSAGLVAGAMSMAAGEFVSVSSQADSEQADLEIEKKHLERSFEYEHKELAQIYQQRGLDKALAEQVAAKLMEHDALDAHARDELGIIERTSARPIQAALSSCGAFTLGALMPLLSVMAVPRSMAVVGVAVLSLVFLVALGMVSARIGGARMLPSVVRVAFWGALAMLVTALVGEWFELAFLV